jgi:citrate synthase
MADAFRLPVEAPLVVFAIGRLAGWVAHALEQIESGELIRPRAHYIGEALQTASSADIARTAAG